MSKHKRIFISHSFDHPDKLVGIKSFIEKRGIRHVDYSVPVWEQLDHDDVQFEIERRIQNCDRVIVIITEGSHKSEWIKQEIEWAQEYGKPVIGVWPHGEAGSAIPKAVAAADAHLIGWRATSLEKALNLEVVGDYRALVLAEDADFDRTVQWVVAAGGAISLLLIVNDILQLTKLRDALRRRGFDVHFAPDWASSVGDAARGALLGAAGGALLGAVICRTEGQIANMAMLGALVGGGYGLHRTLQAEIKQMGALMLLEIKPT